MKNEFVKYEQALELKELGFDEPCLAFYSPKEELHPVFQEPSKGPYFNNGSFIETLRAPLYQQTFRWFREKYGLFGTVDKKDGIRFYKVVDENENLMGVDTSFKTYEEAESACLDKLIEIVKNKQDE